MSAVQEIGCGTTYKDGAFPKRCACGRIHSIVEWTALQFVGIMPGTDDGVRFGQDLEMRLCVCRSTICVPIKEV